MTTDTNADTTIISETTSATNSTATVNIDNIFSEMKVRVNPVIDLINNSDPGNTDLINMVNLHVNNMLSSAIFKNFFSYQDEAGKTLLMHLVIKKNPLFNNLINFILTKNTDSINIRDHANKTALMHAAESGNHDVIEPLCKHGTYILDNPALSSCTEHTVFMLASINNHVTCLAKLKLVLDKNNQDISQKEKDRSLLLAAQHKKTKAAKFLLSIGANLNARDEHKKTAMIHAVNTANTNLIKILSKKGAFLSKKDEEGNTALTLAIHQNYKSCLKIILDNYKEIITENEKLNLFHLTISSWNTNPQRYKDRFILLLKANKNYPGKKLRQILEDISDISLTHCQEIKKIISKHERRNNSWPFNCFLIFSDHLKDAGVHYLLNPHLEKYAAIKSWLKNSINFVNFFEPLNSVKIFICKKFNFYGKISERINKLRSLVTQEFDDAESLSSEEEGRSPARSAYSASTGGSESPVGAANTASREQPFGRLVQTYSANGYGCRALQPTKTGRWEVSFKGDHLSISRYDNSD